MVSWVFGSEPQASTLQTAEVVSGTDHVR